MEWERMKLHEIPKPPHLSQNLLTVTMFWQKRKVKESIPEKILKSTQTKSEDEPQSEDSESISTETDSTQVSNPSFRKKKLNWMLNMIVETIEETVECEPVTVKLRKPKVRRLSLISSRSTLTTLRFLSKHYCDAWLLLLYTPPHSDTTRIPALLNF